MTSERILVVDDEPGMVRSVERVLSHEYTIAKTLSSSDAIALAATFKPDLAILDIQMPGLDGFELMERLRAIDPHLDVIFMTGSTHELDAKLIRAIRKDAFYFLQKPFDREVLLALVDRCLQLKRLDRENRIHLARIEKELAEARAFQQALLPPEHGRIGAVQVFARYIPCSELAGDFYDYAAGAPDQATLLVADVSGHGASAAMLTGLVKSAFHAAGAKGYAPITVVKQVANSIRAFGHRHFITLICARIGPDRIEYVNAGHPSGILTGSKSATVLLPATGPLVSPAFADFAWETHLISLPDRARLLLFTDGIVEPQSDAEEFGMERLTALVQNSESAGNVLLEEVLRSVSQFSAGRPIQDDMTLLAAEIAG